MFSPRHIDMSRLPAGTKFRDVTVGRDHACGLTLDREVYCWGAGGTLGTGAGQINTPYPQKAATPTWLTPR